MAESSPYSSWVYRLLTYIERAGNKLPDPVFIFMGLCALILVASWLSALAGVSAVNPATNETIYAINLLNSANISRIIEEAIKNFASFPPLGVVLGAMIGIGVAEKSGWFEALMKYAMQRAPRHLMIPILAFIGVMGNMAADAAIIVLPPIAAMLFTRMGYHPIAGLVCAYAATLGGFAANLTIGLTDVLALTFTAPATALLNPELASTLNPAMNYYFIAASTFLLVGLTWWITLKITIPYLGAYTPEAGVPFDNSSDLSPQEHKALCAANYTLLALIIGLLFLTVPEGALLRNAQTGSLIEKSPLMNGIVFILAVIFLIPGVVYARLSGNAKESRDIARMMNESMSGMGGYIVIVFFAAQMLAFFNWSHLGTILAIKGAEALQGQSGITLILGIIAISAGINLMIGSASAKWAILAPIFVPMMMLLGYHPAFTQMIYRVGDSITNPITPMMPYMPLILTFAQRYVKNFGMGTLIATLLPYSVVFSIVWTAFLVLWYVLGLPLGPGGSILLNP
ncbi:MAG: AbgT family transporter [Cardiobacteriaceae bacterium]|nr:AbgT family transporter [Cardiobacteriaceae bacterium]